MRLCSGPGCGRAVPNDVRYCDACKPHSDVLDIREHLSGYTPELDALRKSSRWQKLRLLVLRSQPLCARCRRRRAEIVDHIVPAQIAVAQVQLTGEGFGRYAGYFLRSNLQGLCRPCHAAKTLEDKAHTGDWPNVLERESQRPKRAYSF